MMPRREDIDEPNLLRHSQHQSWCPRCMAGRGVGPRHTLVEQQPVVMSDCAYKNGNRGMGRETELELATGAVDEDNLPILVIKDTCSKTIGRDERERRRSQHYNVQGKRRSNPSPRSVHPGNPGAIESAVTEGEVKVRSVKSDLENNLNTQIDRRHPILAWLRTCVTGFMSRHRAGQDGRTVERRRT